MNKKKGKERTFQNIGELIYWSYSNLQMLHYAYKAGKGKYDRLCYMIRSKAFKAYNEGRWNIHDLFELNIEKISDNNHCWYCGKELPLSQLTRDHVFPRSKGGCNDMDNIIMVCKSCNSSKGKMDLFEWYSKVRKEYPPLNVLIHYLKNIYLYCEDNKIMEIRLEDLDDLQLPFNWHFIPTKYPEPSEYLGLKQKKNPPLKDDGKGPDVFTTE